jgi:hypothetical protein
MDRMRKLYMMAAMAAMLQNSETRKYGPLPDYDSENAEAKREGIENKLIQLKLKRGLKWFNIGGEMILALNEKNALRKWNKINKEKCPVQS